MNCKIAEFYEISPLVLLREEPQKMDDLVSNSRNIGLDTVRDRQINVHNPCDRLNNEKNLTSNGFSLHQYAAES